MSRFHKILSFAIFGAGLAIAQDPAAYRRCIDGATSQRAINACANEDARRSDADLNEVYQKLLSAVASQPDFVKKITTAERTWIAYRDAYIDAMYPARDKQVMYGSIFPMEVDLLRAKLTRQQKDGLERRIAKQIK